MRYIQACLLTKKNFFWCFDAGLEHMAARSRGNGTNFDWLRKSCDISTCDLSPDGNPEKYGRPMKSAIVCVGGGWPVWTLGIDWQDLCRPLDIATY